MTETIWVSHLAEQLICEVAEQMGGVRLVCGSAPSDMRLHDREMDAVCAIVGGDYSISIRFDAERAFFIRFARNMLGREPEEDEIQAYARELLNVICGRFISELILRSNVSIKLMPTSYEHMAGCTASDEYGAGVQRLEFISDAKEYAVFSWTSLPIEEMLRRNESK